MYSECSKFHPNPFTSGGVIAERVNVVQTCHKVFPIFGEASASSPSNYLSFFHRFQFSLRDVLHANALHTVVTLHVPRSVCYILVLCWGNWTCHHPGSVLVFSFRKSDIFSGDVTKWRTGKIGLSIFFDDVKTGEGVEMILKAVQRTAANFTKWLVCQFLPLLRLPNIFHLKKHYKKSPLKYCHLNICIKFTHNVSQTSNSW